MCIRMIVKVQLPKAAVNPNPMALVFNKDKSFFAEVMLDSRARRLAGDDNHLIAIVDEQANTVIEFQGEAPRQYW